MEGKFGTFFGEKNCIVLIFRRDSEADETNSNIEDSLDWVENEMLKHF